MRHLSVLSACLALVCANNIYAEECNAWGFSITPYLWAVDINGDIEVGVPADGIPNQLIHVSEGFSDIIKHVNAGGLFDLHVTKGKFGVFTDAMFVNIDKLNVVTSDEFEAVVHTRFSLISVGAYYRIVENKVDEHCKFSVQPYIGARYTNNKSGAYLAEAPYDPTFSSEYHAHWTEPFVGLMLIFDINKYWSINFAGDVGGVNNRQDSYDIIGLLSFKPVKCCIISLGYRQFYQFYTTGSGADYFDWQMHIGGPILGVTLKI